MLKIWDKIFELIQIEVQCSKKIFNFFFTTEAGASVEPMLKIKKIYIIFTQNICSACNPMQMLVFFKHVLIL